MLDESQKMQVVVVVMGAILATSTSFRRANDISTPQTALALEVSKSVLAAIDSLSDDLSYRTEMLAERQEKRQTEIDLLNANITALRVTVSDIAHKTMQTKSLEARLKTMEGRQGKLQDLQDSLEDIIEQKSEQIKKQDEKRRQDAEKSLPGVT
jgi:chromosome segregation ATPase